MISKNIPLIHQQINTLANFVDAYRLTDDEIAAAVERVTAHNRERGRYRPGERRMF